MKRKHNRNHHTTTRATTTTFRYHHQLFIYPLFDSPYALKVYQGAFRGYLLYYSPKIALLSLYRDDNAIVTITLM